MSVLSRWEICIHNVLLLQFRQYEKKSYKEFLSFISGGLYILTLKIPLHCPVTIQSCVWRPMQKLACELCQFFKKI